MRGCFQQKEDALQRLQELRKLELQLAEEKFGRGNERLENLRTFE